jgi:hypothetical protein
VELKFAAYIALVMTLVSSSVGGFTMDANAQLNSIYDTIGNAKNESIETINVEGAIHVEGRSAFLRCDN